MLDMECAPTLIIVACDAAHCGNVAFHLLHCKLWFDVPFLLVYFSACLFNLKESEWSKGLNWVAFAWIPN